MKSIQKAKLKRGALGLAGPILFAGSNFIGALVLQQHSSAGEFGVFAFAQLVIASGIGFSNGLFGAPMLVELVASHSHVERLLASFFKANLVYGVLAAVITFWLLRRAAASFQLALLMSLNGLFMWIRWFLRSVELANHRQVRATIVDASYAAATLLGLGVLLKGGHLGVVGMTLIQLASCFVSLVASCTLFWRLMRGVVHAPFGIFVSSFKKHGIWAIAAVGATEVISNGHSYLITLALGPAAFAPIALATLVFRPLGVVLTGLVQFERPRMALRVAQGSSKDLHDDVEFVAKAALLTWASNVLAALALAFLLPGLLAHKDYDPIAVRTSILLMGLVVLARTLREPQTAAMQAAGHFKWLAIVAFTCAPLTLLIAGGFVLVVPANAPLALMGCFIAEFTALLLVGKRYRRFKLSLGVPS